MPYRINLHFSVLFSDDRAMIRCFHDCFRLARWVSKCPVENNFQVLMMSVRDYHAEGVTYGPFLYVFIFIIDFYIENK